MNEHIRKKLDWTCRHTWNQSAINTLWCLVGCSIGDIGTIYYFQYHNILWSTSSIMILAMINGIIASIILETVILLKQMKIKEALKRASFIIIINIYNEINYQVLLFQVLDMNRKPHHHLYLKEVHL